MSLINKLLSSLTVGAAVVAFSTFTFAQEGRAAPAPDKERTEKRFQGEGHRVGGHKGFGHHGGGMMRMLHGLDLTEAQKTQIKSIMDANKSDESTRNEMHTLFEAKRSGTITAEQQARIDTLKEQAKGKMQAIHQQIEAVLTPEQKAQIEQRKQEMKQRREERREQRQKTPAATTETTKEG